MALRAGSLNGYVVVGCQRDFTVSGTVMTRKIFSGFGLFLAGWIGLSQAASALSIELKDVAADRVERQRAAASGSLPLPGTPNIAALNDRLQQSGISLSAPMLIRVFKAESELEVWKARDGQYVLFATYPICHWSGTLGPKLREGDKQAPEGFYTVTRPQTRHVGRWPKSLYLNYPNELDQSMARTGDLILIHGGCTSVGCFAMTNPVMDEIHHLSVSSIEAGQEHIPIHVFPFRMTVMKMASQALSPWAPFWSNLKEGYDAFERSKRPPVVGICDGRYNFQPAATAWGSGPLQVCGPTLSAIRDQDNWLQEVPTPAASPLRIEQQRQQHPGVQTQLGNGKQSSLTGRGVNIRCNLARASCRRHVSLKTQVAAKRRILAAASPRMDRPRKPQRRG